MRLYKLPETVLSIKGNAAVFLNGISSNTLEAPLNAFLNMHGRIIATFRQHKISDDEFLISVPIMVVENLLKHLERYAKISRVTLERSSWKTYIDLDSKEIIWEQQDFPNAVSESEFTLFRLENQMPLMGIDYQSDEFILNVHEYNYTSYTKGCFLGQEPVAKVHNRSRPTRQLVVRFQDELIQEEVAQMTSLNVDPSNSRTKGFIFIRNKSA